MDGNSEPQLTNQFSSISRVPLIRIILIIAAWSFCIYQVYISSDIEKFLDLAPMLLTFLGASISFVSFCIDAYRYKKTGNLFSFLSSAITLVCVLVFFIIREKLNARDRTPTILYASKGYSGWNTLSLDLRKNGTYKCKTGSFMGTYYIERGRYRLADSMIFLDRSGLFNVLQTDRLLIKSLPPSQPGKQTVVETLLDLPEDDTTRRTLLFQVDKKGDTIPGALSLFVSRNHLGNDD